MVVYRYGRVGASPDLEVRSDGKDGRAYYGETPAQRELFKQLRFVNGDYSYILYEWRGGSGLAVTKGSTDISDRKCVGKGNGFADNAFTGSLNARMAQDQDDAITIR